MLCYSIREGADGHSGDFRELECIILRIEYICPSTLIDNRHEL